VTPSYIRVHPTSCSHGESPVWDVRSSRLFLVDIFAGSGLTLDSCGSIERFSRGGFLTSICLTHSGHLVTSSSRTLSIEGSHLSISLIESSEGTRLNDAKVDVTGCIWVASMDQAESNPIGSLYRITPSGDWSRFAAGLTVGNGIGWSVDNRTMYVTDSGVGCVYCFDFDPTLGGISNRRVFARIPRERGVPDGLTVDCRGGVWSAHFDGGQLTRYHSNGEIDFIIDLPAKSPTSLCFGGKNLSDLYITTSTFGKSTAREHDGSVLRIPTEFTGLAPNRFDDQSHLQSEVNG